MVGIRGIGSIYYLYYALNHGLLNPAAELLVETVLIVIACSVIAHGVSVTPMMAAYDRWRRREPEARRMKAEARDAVRAHERPRSP